MTGDSLYGGWNSALLLVHGRRSLPSCARGCLRIETLLATVMRGRHLRGRLRHEAHLRSVVGRMGGIGRRRALLMPRIHVIVHRRRLSVCWLLILARLQNIGRLRRGLCLGLRLSLSRLGGPLLTHSFGLLLLLNTWCWRLV